MATPAPIGAEAAVEAVREFLENATHGGAGSPAQTLNDVLAVRRTALSVTTSVLPDVVAFHEHQYQGSQSTAGINLSIVWERAEGETEPNSRRFVHRLSLLLFIGGGCIDGSLDAAILAALRYRDAICAMLIRRTPHDAQGWTLNNGGTGAAQGRIAFVDVAGTDILLASEDDDPEGHSLIAVIELDVSVREDY